MRLSEKHKHNGIGAVLRHWVWPLAPFFSPLTPSPQSQSIGRTESSVRHWMTTWRIAGGGHTVQQQCLMQQTQQELLSVKFCVKTKEVDGKGCMSNVYERSGI